QVNPSRLQFLVTPPHAQAADQFLRYLQESVVELKAHPDRYQGGSAALYGMSLSVPDRAVVDGYIREAYGEFMREGGEFSFAQFMKDE
ncbi:MAG: hypothetical protein LIO46_01985, partial [Clostridiales bacterium]|nr:hypothetical protein [Clostridiales bacterium]